MSFDIIFHTYKIKNSENFHEFFIHIRSKIQKTSMSTYTFLIMATVYRPIVKQPHLIHIRHHYTSSQWPPTLIYSHTSYIHSIQKHKKYYTNITYKATHIACTYDDVVSFDLRMNNNTCYLAIAPWSTYKREPQVILIKCSMIIFSFLT